MKVRKEVGKWREYETIRCEHTIITKDWKYIDRSFRELFICPFGMVETMTKFHSNKRNTVWKFMRPEIKETLKLEEKTFNREELEVTVSHMGNLGAKEFHHILCRICVSTVLPVVKQRHSLPEDASLLDVVTTWDKSKISSKVIDLAGCLLPNEPHINAGPNARRFIVRPEDHDLHETYLKESKSKSKNAKTEEPPSTSSSSAGASSSSADVPSLILSPNRDGLLTTKRKNAEEGTVIHRNNQKVVVHIGKKTQQAVKMMPVNSLIDPRIDLKSPCNDKSDIWSKEFMLKVLHTGVKKHVSNETSLEFYGTVMDGIRKYHEEVIPDIKLDNKVLTPPPKVRVNKDNIDVPLDAILNSFKDSPCTSNPYNVLLKQESGKCYSIMHDGIQKFQKELNGVMVRNLSENNDITTVPWKLSDIPGGSLDSEKLVVHILDIIKSIHSLGEKAADQEVTRLLMREMDAVEFPKPLQFFEVCTLLHFDCETKVINLEMPNWPLAVIADGCSTNIAAGDKLLDRIGLISPNMRCGSHAGDGSLKRLANSKTMNVPAVSDWLIPFRKIMKHFKLSGKSTSVLNDVLEIMGMRKVHMMTFCPTRMSYLLSACAQAVNLLVPLCNVLVSMDIKKEQRDSFLSPKSMFIMHILGELDTPFKKYFLRSLDGDNGLIIDTYRINLQFVEMLKVIQFPKLSSFVDNLQMDEYGNLSAVVNVGSNIHDIVLNFTHRPARGIDRMAQLKEEAETLKKSIVDNLVTNINDQNQSGTLFEYASAFDLHRKIDLDQRVVYLEELAKIYCCDYVHNVESGIDDDFWEEYQISIRYPKKIDGDKSELIQEFRNIYPICNRKWKDYALDLKEGNLRFWRMICSFYSISHPNVCKLGQILFSISGNTGPLEQSYSQLAKICYKDRNKLQVPHMETQYLLSVLKCYEFDYAAARQYLEK